MSKQNEKPVTTRNGTVLMVNPKSSSCSTGKDWYDFYLKVKKFLQKIPKLCLPKNLGMELP